MARSSAVSVVVVCHDSADEITNTLRALRKQLGSDDEVVIVDNASRDGTVDAVREADPQATIVARQRNAGFAAACIEGVARTSASLIVLLNPDAIPADGCIDALHETAATHPEWGAWQALVTLPDGVTVNTAGNVVHWLGFGWAGGIGRRLADIEAEPHEVPFASGAAMVVRRAAWDRVGGFDERYFMYGEDLDLSLRLRLAGWGVGVVPRARVAHAYEFAKGDYKWFYLERNRWWTVLATYPPRLLALTIPALLAFEAALAVAAWRGGWLRAKLRAQGAVALALPAMLRRRRAVQSTRVIAAREFASNLTASLDSPYLAGAAQSRWMSAAQRWYWRAVQEALR